LLPLIVFVFNFKPFLNQIKPPTLSLPREILAQGFNHPDVVNYHFDQRAIAIEYGATRKRARVEMKDVLDFEIALAKVSSRNILSKDYFKLKSNST
jgi:hypothetical protein